MDWCLNAIECYHRYLFSLVLVKFCFFFLGMREVILPHSRFPAELASCVSLDPVNQLSFLHLPLRLILHSSSSLVLRLSGETTTDDRQPHRLLRGPRNIWGEILTDRSDTCRPLVEVPLKSAAHPGLPLVPSTNKAFSSNRLIVLVSCARPVSAS